MVWVSVLTLYCNNQTEPEPTARKTVHTTPEGVLGLHILIWTLKYLCLGNLSSRELSPKELRIDPQPIKWGLDVYAKEWVHSDITYPTVGSRAIPLGRPRFSVMRVMR